MAQRYGGKIVTDGLVLCLDAHDAKSYAGEPVTNLVTSSAVDFSVRSTYTGSTFSQVADSESPSGYACEMSYTTFNNSARSRFGAATNIPTSGTGFISIWVKKSVGPSTTMRPAVYPGSSWYILDPLDGGSSYLTEEYRPFGKAVSFWTSSGGPNPGFSMTHGGGSTVNDKTRWIKPQVTTLSYNVPFANLSRSATNGWVDRSGNSNDGTLTNMEGTDASHYRYGQVIMPVANSYLDFDGTNDYVVTSSNYSLSGSQTFEVWFMIEGGPSSPAGLLTQHDYTVPANFGINHVSNNKLAPSIGYTDNTREYSSKTTATTFSHDTLYHAALVYDSSANKVIWYVNGVYDNQYTLSKTPQFAAKPFQLGRWSYNYNSYYYNGRVYKASVYGNALTAAEVLSNYNTVKPRFGL